MIKVSVLILEQRKGAVEGVIKVLWLVIKVLWGGSEGIVVGGGGDKGAVFHVIKVLWGSGKCTVVGGDRGAVLEVIKISVLGL